MSIRLYRNAPAIRVKRSIHIFNVFMPLPCPRKAFQHCLRVLASFKSEVMGGGVFAMRA